MADLVFLEEHPTFASASQRARALAIQHKQQTGVRSSPSGWEVLVPPHLSNPAVRGYAADSDEYEPIDYGYEDDEREQIAQELEDDREDYARSEEDGWYYGDDQQPNRDEHDSQYGRFQAPRDPWGRTLPTGSGC